MLLFLVLDEASRMPQRDELCNTINDNSLRHIPAMTHTFILCQYGNICNWYGTTCMPTWRLPSALLCDRLLGQLRWAESCPAPNGQEALSWGRIQKRTWQPKHAAFFQERPKLWLLTNQTRVLHSKGHCAPCAGPGLLPWHEQDPGTCEDQIPSGSPRRPSEWRLSSQAASPYQC
jgi:hypothetical protein